jgi:hypothetical protein
MVAELWSEITQDKFSRMKDGFVFEEEEMLTSIRTLLEVLFFLATGGATRDGAFLLSEVELIRFGSDVAYLDISWAKVVDLNPRQKLGLQHCKKLS